MLLAAVQKREAQLGRGGHAHRHGRKKGQGGHSDARRAGHLRGKAAAAARAAKEDRAHAGGLSVVPICIAAGIHAHVVAQQPTQRQLRRACPQRATQTLGAGSPSRLVDSGLCSGRVRLPGNGVPHTDQRMPFSNVQEVRRAPPAHE